MLVMGLVLAVFLGLIPGFIAQTKGHSFFAWWIFGFLLWIVALPCALLLKPDQATLDSRALENDSMRRCPHCAEIVRRQASVCRFCGRDILPPGVT